MPIPTPPKVYLPKHVTHIAEHLTKKSGTIVIRSCRPLEALALLFVASVGGALSQNELMMRNGLRVAREQSQQQISEQREGCLFPN